MSKYFMRGDFVVPTMDALNRHGSRCSAILKRAAREMSANPSLTEANRCAQDPVPLHLTDDEVAALLADLESIEKLTGSGAAFAGVQIGLVILAWRKICDEPTQE